MITFEYCPSAYLSFSGAESILGYAIKNNDENLKLYCKETLELLKDAYNENHIDVSVMFNAQYEGKNAHMIGELRDRGLRNLVHADSGGLQVQTQGLDLEKEKPGIYKYQGAYSDLAMSFDEMPVITVGERNKNAHTRKNFSERYFIGELAFEKGAKSGRNIKEQIEVFMEQGTHTKVLVIIQGYTLEDYNEYARGLYSEIPEEYYDKIKGVSFGATGLQSYDEMVDLFLRMQRDLTNVPKQHLKHIHLLGSGTLDRIYPLLLLADSDYFDFDFEFSFDASTHCSASTWGKFTEEKSDGKFKVHTLGGYNRNPLTEKYLEQMYEATKVPMQKYFKNANTKEEFIQNYTVFNKDKKRLKGDMDNNLEYLHKSVMYSYNTFVLESLTFLKMINDFAYGKNPGAKFSNKWRKLSIPMIQGLKDYDDYIAKKPTLTPILNKIRSRQMAYAKTVSEAEGKHITFDEWE